MNFELTMEQQQLKDSVTNFARQHLGGKLGAYDLINTGTLVLNLDCLKCPFPMI